MKTRLAKAVPLISPDTLRSEMPITPELEAFHLESVMAQGRIITKRDKRLAIWAGGCSFDNPDHAEAMADLIVELQPMFPNLVLGERVFAFKSRSEVTMPIHWEGAGYDPHFDNSHDYELGLRWTRESLMRVMAKKVPTLIEFIDLISPNYLMDLVIQIVAGARCSQAGDYRRLCSEVAASAALKNPTSGNFEVAAQSVHTAMTPQVYPSIDQNGQLCQKWSMGNPYAHLVLRGGDNGPNYQAPRVAEATRLLRKRGIKNGVGIDPCHAQCDKNPALVPAIIEDIAGQRFDGNDDIVELIIEVDLDGHFSRTDRGLTQSQFVKCLEMLNEAVA